MSLLKQLSSCRSRAVESADDGYVLDITMVSQDAQTRQWAEEVYNQAVRLAGEQHVRASRWNVHDLNRPGVLTDAVSTTMRSDVIVVSIHAAKELPLSFYLWADLWLPHGPGRSGVLLAFVGTSDITSLESERTRQYLTGLSHRARLDLLMQERIVSGHAAHRLPQPLSQPPAIRRMARPFAGAGALLIPKGA